VSGVVQGVGFRASTRDEALRYPGVSGWVRNLADGRVEAVFVGERAQVEKLVEWCRQGPPGSRVDDVEVVEEPPDSALVALRRFELRRG
jgi:acylphosphatase